MEVAERGAEGVGMRPVGTEAHEARQRAAHDGRRMRVVALAVEIGAVLVEEEILDLLQPAFVDQARAARRGEHRHVVDDVDLEVGRERDHVAVEIGRLDQAREVEGGRILALRALIERVDQRERVAAVAVEREREDFMAAAIRAVRAAVGPRRERLRRAVRALGHRRQRDVVDLLAVRRDAEVVGAGGDREREAGIAAVAVDRRPVGAEAHQIGDRARDRRRRAARAVIIPVAVEVAEAGRRERECALIDAARGIARAGEHRHVVDDRDLEVARERNAVAVEIDCLDEAGEVEDDRILAGALRRMRIVERVDEREGPLARALVEPEREDLVAGVARARPSASAISPFARPMPTTSTD